MKENEKSESKFFPIVFGIMGLTLVVLAWAYPADTSDRILAAVIGSAGIFGAIIRMPKRKLNRRENAGETTRGESRT
ncbi:MAG: hypothetical protein PVG61_07495 [Dehalococcoidia bacterium]|jgi:FtsH-binding integral membrane protein